MRACCVAVGEFSEVVKTQRDQAQILVPMTVGILKKANLSFSDLDAIAVSVGPGSFTGVRVGISTARSLGLALDIPAIGLSTLDILGVDKSKAFTEGEKTAILNGTFATPCPLRILELSKDDENHLQPIPIYLRDPAISHPKKAARQLLEK